MNEILLLLTLLMFKHTVADFYVQRSFMFTDKHVYGGRGGVAHAGIHGIGTAIVLFSFFNPAVVLLASFFDSVAHYHIDYVKSKLQQIKNIQPVIPNIGSCLALINFCTLQHT